MVSTAIKYIATTISSRLTDTATSSRPTANETPSTNTIVFFLQLIGLANTTIKVGVRMSIVTFFAVCEELIIQSVDLARLIGRDILLMQGSQFMLGWLVVMTVANRPWSLVKGRGALCVSCAERSRSHGLRGRMDFMRKHV
jgi:hypothetical protein